MRRPIKALIEFFTRSTDALSNALSRYLAKVFGSIFGFLGDDPERIRVLLEIILVILSIVLTSIEIILKILGAIGIVLLL